MKRLGLAAILLAGCAAPHGGPTADAFDVVVYGGTPGGIAAATASAKEGLRTLLVEPTRHVGGMVTSGLMATEASHMNLRTFGGFWLDYYRRLGAKYGRTRLVFSTEKRAYAPDELSFRGVLEPHKAEQTFNEMLAEAGVAVRLDRRLRAVVREDRRIARIRLSDGREAAGRVFIDASYEGDLLAMAGVSYAVGRESRAQHGEPLAGIRLADPPFEASPYDDDGRLLPGIEPGEGLVEGAGDGRVMNYNVRVWLTPRPDLRVPIAKPERYDPKRYLLLARYLAKHPETRFDHIVEAYAGPNGKYEGNNRQNAVISLGLFGGNVDYPEADEARRAEIVRDHFDYTQGLFWFLQNDPAVPAPLQKEARRWGLPRDEFVDNGHWPWQIYVREARRMTGSYVMTQHDIQDDRTKPDSIGLGSHFIDGHHVQRIAVSRTQFANEGRLWVEGRTYEIPYRSITPRPQDCENLLVPVAASFSHVAFCSFRVEPTWMMVGQASGLAAAQAIRERKPVQAIDVPALQRRLRAVGLPIDLAQAGG